MLKAKASIAPGDEIAEDQGMVILRTVVRALRLDGGGFFEG